jgi:hypothetical protein
VILTTYKRLPDSVATTLAAVAAIGSSILVGAAIGFLVSAFWFSNTRSDGVAAFLVASIAGGLFTSVLAFVSMVCRHHVPAQRTVLLPAVLWLIVAIQLTWTTCKGSFITANNVLWILKSGDQRNYELGWLIRGWAVIVASLVAALSASRMILKGRYPQSPLPPASNSHSC